MLPIAGALVLGIVVGLVTGGSIRRIADVQFHWWLLAILGLGLQFVPVPSTRAGHALGVGLLVASYGLLLLFVVMNVGYRGFVIMGIGFAMNLLVIAVNAGMPVDNHALRAAYGPRYPALLRELRQHGGAKHHLERPSDRLTAIDDGIPIGTPVHLVYAPGDFVQLAGLAVVAFEATRPRRMRYKPKHLARGR
jgi:Family of unknown function (DUF5317)